MKDFRRLLLIDDEPGIRRMMSLDLTADGYQVVTAEDGESGLALFERERPDIVLTDLKMPGMDGIEVLKRIKRQNPMSEVIIITGHGDLELAIQSLQLDASDFVTKPVSDQALAVALARARERLRMRTEIKEHTEDLERRVAEATARVLVSERLAAVGQTVATLVHSLKNMLSGLQGGTYMARQGLTTGDRDMSDQGVAMLQRNLVRVGRLVRDLLTLSKPRQPELAESSVNAVCLEAVQMMRAEAGDKGVELDCRLDEGEIIAVMDQKAVLDALLNLVGNGIDAASEVKEGRVELSARLVDDQVRLEVTDNGPGLEPDAAARIFQGFYSSKGAAGTGLGLMVSHKIAAEHGGRVEFDSAQGRGAAFRLILPRRPSSPGSKAPAGNGPNHPAEADAPF
jgi:signal transduction histidine kinase